MPRIDLEQGSPEWLKYRQAHIMATSASVIMEANPWRTSFELWEEMLGMRPAVTLNKKMEEGQKLEPKAREIASKTLGFEFTPCVYESDKFSWMAASLDGICPDNKFILEIKCGKSAHEMAIEGEIPIYYHWQMQHQLLVTGANQCYYFTYRPDYKEQPTVLIQVDPNAKMFDTLLEAEQKFWYSLCTLQPPAWILKSSPCNLLV